MDFYDAIKKRHSIRKYKSDAISDEVLNRVLDAAHLAPSGKNGQPWRFIVVRNAELKQKLVKPCRDQIYIAEAPIVIVGVANEDESYQKQGCYMKSWAIDLAIAFDHLILAATAEGLGTCWIGAFDEKEVKKVLNIPDHLRVVCLTPLGYADGEPKPKPRKALGEIVFYDQAPKN
ncbi:MAG: nitroreductase family protein [Planctomycetes bacterium]|nr:nitroreductase family protein [Planctomycetota bacterium]